MNRVISAGIIISICFCFCNKQNEPPIGTGNQLVLETLVINGIYSDSARSGGNVKSDGGETILERGICWSTRSKPTILDSINRVGGTIGLYNATLKNLIPNRQYYVRAYAKNKHGTVYGEEEGFKTNTSTALVNTLNISSIAQTTANINGSVTNDGGSNVTQRGFCWNNAPLPTTGNSVITSGIGIGNFSALLTGLVAGNTYYVRAFAINSNGTSYGNQLTFITLSPVLPLLTTISPTSITATTATSGGSISSDGGSTVTQRGVCWSTSSSPTIGNNRTINGSGIGSFTSSVTGLVSGTTYYLRAYATNSQGTAYGNQYTFTTPSQLPNVTTNSVFSITTNSAISGGNVAADGGSSVTQRGVCWSTSSLPTIANSRTINGSGLGSFSSSVTGLQPGTTYYLRAYALNSQGAAYGSQISFTTLGYGIGSTGPAGGLIFYDKGSISNGWRYLEAAPTDQSSSAQWGCFGTNISGASTTGIGAGQSNTTAIVNGCFNAGIAARICDQFVLNGYSDWFLPSYSEMNLMYQNLKSRGLGGFSNTFYWNSNQYNSTNASVEDFSTGTIYSAGKSGNYRVRAIRAF